MIVSELIELLKDFDQNAEVKISIPTGNYWNMVKAEDVTSVSDAKVQYSVYLGMDEVPTDEDSIEDYDSLRDVVLIGLRILLLAKNFLNPPSISK